MEYSNLVLRPKGDSSVHPQQVSAATDQNQSMAIGGDTTTSNKPPARTPFNPNPAARRVRAWEARTPFNPHPSAPRIRAWEKPRVVAPITSHEGSTVTSNPNCSDSSDAATGLSFDTSDTINAGVESPARSSARTQTTLDISAKRARTTVNPQVAALASSHKYFTPADIKSTYSPTDPKSVPDYYGTSYEALMSSSPMGTPGFNAAQNRPGEKFCMPSTMVPINEIHYVHGICENDNGPVEYVAQHIFNEAHNYNKPLEEHWRFWNKQRTHYEAGSRKYNICSAVLQLLHEHQIATDPMYAASDKKRLEKLRMDELSNDVLKHKVAAEDEPPQYMFPLPGQNFQPRKIAKLKKPVANRASYVPDAGEGTVLPGGSSGAVSFTSGGAGAKTSGFGQLGGGRGKATAQPGVGAGGSPVFNPGTGLKGISGYNPFFKS